MLHVALTALCFLRAVSGNNSTNSLQIRIAWFCSNTSMEEQYGDNASSSVTPLLYGLQQVQSYLSVPVTFNVTWYNDECDYFKAAGMAVSALNADYIIGPMCSVSMQEVGALMTYMNNPLTTTGAISPIFFNYNIIRMMMPVNRFTDRFLEMFREYNWNSALLLQMDDYVSSLLGADVISTFQSSAIEVYSASTYQNASEATIAQSYMSLTQRFNFRIFLLITPINALRACMIAAYDSGMISAGYIFITYDYGYNLDVVGGSDFWMVGDGEDYKIKQAFTNLLIVRVTDKSYSNIMSRAYNGQLLVPATSYSQFQIQASLGATQYVTSSFVNSTGQLPPPVGFAAFGGVLFDGIRLFAMSLNYSMYTNITLADGVDFMNIAQLFQFNGISGAVIIDNNGDRLTNFLTLGWLTSATQWQVLYATAFVRNGGIGTWPSQTVVQIAQPIWPDGSVGVANAPADTICVSGCGVSVTTIGLIVGFSLFSVLLSVFLTFYIRMQRKVAANSSWNLKFEDVTIVGETGAESNSAVGSKGSSSQLDPDTDADEQFSVNSQHQIAIYMEDRVFLKRLVRVQSTKVNSQMEAKFRIMRGLNHQNVNGFIGIATAYPDVCILWTLCPKGSLRDVLNNESITLGNVFNLSFITDILRGMDYLHRSALLFHGRLSSNNVLVDSKWTCLVTDYGYIEGMFPQAQFQSARQSVSSSTVSRSSTTSRVSKEHQALLWMPAEHLVSQKVRYGNRFTDAYAFGIIVYEILSRQMPYAHYRIPARDIVQQLQSGRALQPFLYDQISIGDIPIEVQKLAHNCITLPADERPDFEGMWKSMQKIKGISKNSNAVENLIRMMETYTSNLEQVISERTKRLVEEEKKAEVLLYKMLPRKIADDLKQGKSVPAESFEEVTIYFSDVVGFTTICSTSTPMEVITFLNKLYSIFDEIISRHDVYKVETIGDAYMVASGVPVPIGPSHVTEICDCALDILTEVERFEIPHMRHRPLQVRIGIHSGSCATGVVGLAMPDTINTASRMESTGLPMHIQVSANTRNLLVKRGPYLIKPRGESEVKGKGTMFTFWLVGKLGHSDFSKHVNENEVYQGTIPN